MLANANHELELTINLLGVLHRLDQQKNTADLASENIMSESVGHHTFPLASVLISKTSAPPLTVLPSGKLSISFSPTYPVNI